jgi:hypothetical protein
MALAMKRRILAAAIGALCVVAGCNLLLRNNGDAVGAAAADASADAVAEASTVACGIPAGTEPCQACLVGACCTAASSCAGDPGCAGYESCLVPCGTDYACRAQCVLDHRAGSSKIVDFDVCLAQNCQSECGVSCGIINADTSPDAADTCQACITGSETDCKAAQACAVNVECQQVAGCMVACATPDCQQACSDGKDAGAALLQSFLVGFGGNCSAACKYNERWDCVGKRGNPLPNGPQTQLTVVVSQWSPGQNVAGAQVLACIDPACNPPTATGTTDASGQVVLTFPDQGNIGFGGYLDVSASGYVPERYFLAYQLSELRSTIAVRLATQLQLTAEFAVVPGLTLDSTRGVVVVDATDCDLQGAAGITVHPDGIDAETRLLYVANGYISATATATDALGAAVLVNVPPATNISLTATPQALGRPSSHASVLVRAGTISYVELLPNL